MTWGGKGLLELTSHVTVPHEGVRPELKGDWNQEAEIETEAMKECCYWLVPRTTITGVVPPTMGWTLLYQSLIMKMTYRPAYSPVLWRHFLN